MHCTPNTPHTFDLPTMWTQDWPVLSYILLVPAFAELLRRFVGWVKRSRSRPPLPPGPRSLPVLGRFWGVNLDAPWLTFKEWARVHGDLIHIEVFRQHIIILNSAHVSNALMDGRSANYSDRPVLKSNSMFGLDFNSGMLPYGEEWRTHRKLFHQSFRKESAMRYLAMQEQKALQLLLRLLDNPAHHLEHLHTYTASVIMSAVYNHDVKSNNDELVELIHRANMFGNFALDPRIAVPLNAFPFIIRLPDWFPGASIKHMVALSRKCVEDWVELPFQCAQKALDNGATGSFMVADALNQRKGEPITDLYVQATKAAAATAFAAGEDSTASMLHVFMLAMVLYPRVQEKAYNLIQSVVGTERLPTFADRESMPFIDAILREILRWHPTTPLSVPHATTNDDIYEGYFIPKGSFVLTNVWAITHDENKYADPEEFMPERFINDDGSLNEDTMDVAFGFGRRKCPGKHLAEATLWIGIATMLATFRFSKSKNENGQEVEFEPQWISGVTTRPLPFPCDITPRVKGINAETLMRMAQS